MRMCNLALAEMTEAMARGWEGRNSRVVMLLQQERAGIEIAVEPERMKEALAAREPGSSRTLIPAHARESGHPSLGARGTGSPLCAGTGSVKATELAPTRAPGSHRGSPAASCARSTTGTSIILPSTEIEPRPRRDRLVVGRDDLLRRRDLVGARREFLVQDRDLRRVDHRGAAEAEPARAPHGLAERVEVLVVRDRADEAERQDAGGARRDRKLLLRHEQRLGGRQHAHREREVLAAERQRDDALARLGDLRHAGTRRPRVSIIAMNWVVPTVMPRSASSSLTTSAISRM